MVTHSPMHFNHFVRHQILSGGAVQRAILSGVKGNTCLCFHCHNSGTKVIMITNNPILPIMRFSVTTRAGLILFADLNLTITIFQCLLLAENRGLGIRHQLGRLIDDLKPQLVVPRGAFTDTWVAHVCCYSITNLNTIYPLIVIP